MRIFACNVMDDRRVFFHLVYESSFFVQLVSHTVYSDIMPIKYSKLHDALQILALEITSLHKNQL